jgi:hypothetical protein
MTLSFPNLSRAYDAVRRCVSFWGHDGWTEITFDVGEDALQRINPQQDFDEASSLRAFDAHRGQIEHVAGIAYAKRRQNYHRLSASDFRAAVGG